MKGRWFAIILLVGLLLALVWNVRERFGPTPQIQAPPSGENSIYGDDVLNVLLSFLDTRPQLKNNFMGITGENQAKMLVSTEATRFYRSVYVPATTPITMQNVATFLQSIPGEQQGIGTKA